MNAFERSSESPDRQPAESEHDRGVGVPRFRISLSLMLVMMVVFAFLSAALFYAGQVPMIREELSQLFYGESGKSGEDLGRLAHRTFILFTVTSPLMLACILSFAVSLMNRLQRKPS